LQAVELDDKNIKAHLISGQILCEQGKFGDNKKIELAITRLTKGLLSNMWFNSKDPLRWAEKIRIRERTRHLYLQSKKVIMDEVKWGGETQKLVANWATQGSLDCIGFKFKLGFSWRG
jgi:hypothetical protein